MTNKRDAFDKWAEDFDHDSARWEDMGRDEIFYAGMAAAEAGKASSLKADLVVTGRSHTPGFVVCAEVGGHGAKLGQEYVAAQKARQPANNHRAGYAGVNVWMGDKAASIIIDRLEFDYSRADALQRAFEEARAAIEAATLENQDK